MDHDNGQSSDHIEYSKAHAKQASFVSETPGNPFSLNSLSAMSTLDFLA